MYLKKIESIGFKSFAEKISVDLTHGLTAIVGPNGSGKSNIIDAVRWVLGEQSAKSLRGRKMEDIIFAGTDLRAPLNLAEVTLTFDNQDQKLPLQKDEIEITRRLYRTGESEYLINQQTCRLKDIVELLMESGLSRDSFAIISQGRVDEILNSKPEDRRSIIEDAAGVLKYKQRKKESEKKLADTKDNLLRVYDIIQELEQQIEPLREQSAIAQEYLSLKEELKAYDIGVVSQDILTASKTYKQLQQDIQSLINIINNSEQQLQQDTAHIDTLKSDYQQLETLISSLHQQELQFTSQVEQAQGQINVLNERNKNQSENDQNYEKELQQLQQAIKLIKQDTAHLQQHYQQLIEQKQQKKSQLKHLNQQTTNFEAQIEQQLETLKNQHFSLLTEQTEIENKLHYQATQQTQDLEQQQRIQQRLTQLDDEITNKEQQLIDFKQQLVDFNTHFSQLSQQYDKQSAEYLVIEEQRAAHRQKLQQGYQLQSQLTAKLSGLERLINENSTFYSGVRAILQQKQNGIHGAVVEVIQVDSNQRIAIETALGATQQYVIVDDEQIARAAINKLKQLKAGRATFLPLSIIQSKQLPQHIFEEIYQHEGFVGIAADLIKYDAKYRSIMHHLLGQIIIAKNLVAANQLAKIINYRYRIVTLEGDVVNAGGAMTGGANKHNQQSILQVKEEHQQLQQQLNTLQQQLVQLEKTIEGKETYWQELEQQIPKLRQQFEQQKLQQQQLEIQMTNQQNELDQLQLLHKHTAEELDIIKQRGSNLDNTLYQQKLAEINQQIININSDINEKKSEQLNSKAAFDKLMQTIATLKMDIALLEEQIKVANEKIEDKTELLYSTEQKLAQVQNNINVLKTSQVDDQTLLKQYSEQLTNDRLKLSQIQQELSDKQQQKINLQLNINKHEKLLHNAELQLAEHKNMLTNQQVQYNRLDVQIEHLMTYLEEEYQLTAQLAQDMYPLTTDYDQAKQQVKLLKLSIDELGEVNIGAIAEFERINTRYQFLSEQKLDLEEAQDLLYGVINEIDLEVTTRFKTTFDQVAQAFNHIFEQLFHGGYAELILDKPEDLLLSGIEINAQPPGKKLQHMSLLSGGERALTAIALLFAILKVKSMPFVILDEVEAALDETNVIRYAEYLQIFSKETQFIVITHRKGTMARMDTLYGITMQEHGVSRVVSVQLSEIEKHIDIKE